MAFLAEDPLEAGGIASFGRRFRRGETTAEAAVEAYLARISALDPRLGAFEHVAGEDALAAARALDRLIATGTDLGPLMGVAVAVKDIIAVDGMPTTAGSNLDVTDIIGPEGPFVKALRRAGCVILGKTVTEEFARGGPTGLNPIRGTPWNPWDAETHRIPGGSSSGSGVAAAAALCGFAIGSDTGGSVRLPACYCGVFGLLPTWGTWPTSGVYPTCPSLDAIGPLTRSAEDGAIVYSALTGIAVPKIESVRGLRLGRPVGHFLDGLDADVEQCFAATVSALADAGAIIIDTEIPEVSVCDDFFRVVIGGEFLAGMGRERFLAHRHEMGFIVAERGSSGLDVSADAYVEQRRRQDEMSRAVNERLRAFDAVITPTIPVVAAPVSDFPDLEAATNRALPIPRNTYFANLFRLCATSLPAQGPGTGLPVGFQVACRGGDDARLLAISRAIEGVMGPVPKPDLAAFHAKGRT
jgi:aspartyl-tRNA(Asn)/glutamyl-tRNA(Gln) amidotransferase subunit A